MKKSEKRGILILIVVALIIIAVVLMLRNRKTEVPTGANEVEEEFVQVLDDGTKLNISEKLKETKRIEGLELTDFQLTENDNQTVLLGTITNTSATTQGGFLVDIKVVDKLGNEIVTVKNYIKKLEAGESTSLITSATFDYANAYDFTVSRAQ